MMHDIKSPQDIRHLNSLQLQQLADEIRGFILYKISETGGHLASNLGSIELTIAIHYAYNTPYDLLVWDVGHQSYTHKILTGRFQQMSTLRQFGGIAGFPKRDESNYDTFGTGHSSTSISAALGMAIAQQQLKQDNKIVAVIGDGAMTAGLAFEGLNNAGWLNTNILVILNDNEMSISENVGAISRYLSKILVSRFYNSIKNTANKMFGSVGFMRSLIHKLEEHIKGMFLPSTMFEEFGFNYLGPIDGHNIDELISTLSKIKHLPGPQFLHVVTKKGYGYKLAENNPIAYHGVTKFDPIHGMRVDEPSMLTYTQVFGRWLCDLAEQDEQFVAITPAMREGSGMVEFARLYPDKFFDVGIAEQHAITFAAGIATTNVKPIVAIYSTFLQRGYDQLIHDVALQNLPVMFAVDRAGIVGADGPTHMGVFDISFLRCIPNMIVMTPQNENECYHMFWYAYRLSLPCVVRYPRGGRGSIHTAGELHLEVGRGEILHNPVGAQIVIFGFGPIVQSALVVAKELNITLCNMRFIKPLDYELIRHMSSIHKYVVCIEENVIAGGAGSACLEAMQDMQIERQTLLLGIKDIFPPHGDLQSLYKLCGLDVDGIRRSILERFLNDNSR